jgi:hypothetical protein
VIPSLKKQKKENKEKGRKGEGRGEERKMQLFG